MLGETLDLLRREFLDADLTPYPILAVRLAGAVVLCGLIGWEREASNHAAGFRTHILVGVGAATFALVTLNIISEYGHRPDTIRMDPIRLIEATTAGVGFLAAGMVVLSRGRVKNLTTGAGMWLAAAVGLSCGLGLWPLALTAAGLTVAVNALSWLR